MYSVLRVLPWELPEGGHTAQTIVVVAWSGGCMWYWMWASEWDFSGITRTHTLTDNKTVDVFAHTELLHIRLGGSLQAEGTGIARLSTDLW